MQTAIRDAVVGYLNPLYVAAYPSIPIVYDNGPFDWNNPPETFVEVELEFYGGEQVGMAASPRRRISGYLYVCVRTREGRGSREALQLIDWFSNTLKFARVGTVVFREPEPEPSDGPPGWYFLHVKVPFLSDPG